MVGFIRLVYYLLVVIFIITHLYHLLFGFMLSVVRVLEGSKGNSAIHHIALI